MVADVRFLTGFFAGFVVAGLLGYFSQQLRNARAKVNAFHKPQAVAQTTSQTPAQILRGCIFGAINYVLWLVAFLVFLVFFGFVLYQMLL